MRLALCQINATVGDIAGNAELVRSGIHAGREAGADLVLFPELILTGYPPEDLLLKEHFLADARAALEHDRVRVRGDNGRGRLPGARRGRLQQRGGAAGRRVQAIYRKVYLPNYGVFDEQRYFQSGAGGAVIELAGHRVGLTVCEDIWEPGPPASDEALAGATLIVNISASPYHAGKGAERERMFAQRARDNLAAVAFCALVGGQDELIFDGHSCVIDHTGRTIARAPPVREEVLVCDVDLDAAAAARLRDAGHRPAARTAGGRPVPVLAELAGADARTARAAPAAASSPSRSRRSEAEVYGALVLGLRDYVAKNGFQRVVLGLSGGIDSALVACLAVDALGAEPRQHRDHALPVLLERHPGRRAGARRRARRAGPRAPDRAGDGLPTRTRCASSSPAASPTSPRRTCRRGSAATC